MSVSGFLNNFVPGGPQQQEAQGLQQIAGEAQQSAVDQRNYMQAALGQSMGYYAPAANMYDYWLGGSGAGGASVPGLSTGASPYGYTPNLPTFAPLPNNTLSGVISNGVSGMSSSLAGAMGQLSGGQGSQQSGGSSGGSFFSNPLSSVSALSETPTMGPARATTSTYDPNTNYGNSGMSQSAYEAMYGTPNQQGAAAASAAAGASAQGNNQANSTAVNPTLSGYTGPAPTGWTSTGNGTYAPPVSPSVLGAAAGGQFNQTASQGPSGANGAAGQPGSGPANQNAGYSAPGGALMQPGTGEQAFNAYGGSVTAPNAAENYYSQYGGQAAGPGAAQNYYQGTVGSLLQPGLAQQAYGQAQNTYNSQSPLSASYNSLFNAYGSPSALAQQSGQLQQGYQAPTSLQRQSQGLEGMTLGGSALQNNLGQQYGQLQSPGALEQFAASDANGTNPYYAQQSKLGLAALGQQFNAGGNYDSGARMAADAMFQSNLAAQAYQQEGQLQGAAQQAQQSRFGQQQNVLGNASANQLQQLGQTQNLLQSGDTQQMAQLQAQQGLAQANASQNLAQLSGASGLANQATTQNLNYANSNVSSANTAQQAYLNSLGLGGSLANQANSQNLAGLSLGGQLASTATNAQQAAYNDYLNQAQNAQSAAQSRAQLGLGSSLALGGQQANLAATMYGNSNDAYANMIAAALGAQVNAQQVQAQGGQAQQNALYGLIGGAGL